MADVVDIPEFRAFYYTDDTPRQFYTLRRYEDESGSGKMHCYNIAPGIQLSFNDLNLSSCYQPLNVQKDFLEINYCLEGGHEVEMVGGGITFLGEKDLSISGLYHDKRVIVVLDKGKVTEVGTPSELAKKGGLYAHLVALQQKQQMSSLPT